MHQRSQRRLLLTHGHIVPAALAVVCALLLAIVLPATFGAGSLPIASAHAELVRSDPGAHAILQAPPSQVRLWFSEDVNAGTSHAVVVDTANREVDNHDGHVSASDATQMEVSLPLLPAGTYVVAWQAQSSDDGHVTSGSFYFQVARPDGSVPPIPAQLPNGHFPGAGGSSATGGAVDAQTLIQAAFTWLALLFMTFWVGGLIWETWILAPGSARDPDVAEAAVAAARRYRRLAANALPLLLVMDVGIVLAEAADLAGEWSGAVSPPLLHAILFGSRYGGFWWMRQLTALAALVLLYVAERRGWQPHRALPVRLGGGSGAEEYGSAVPDWRREVLKTLRGVRRLPRRLASGWHGRSLFGRVELLLGALLVVAFALSGHAAAVPAREFAYALSVDLFHLVCEAAWVGGLFYISVVFVPALAKLTESGRARVLALGLPEFGAVAIVCAVALAATGSLNTSIHLTSIQQFLTTAYGRILGVKIEFFLFMVAISAYHAFLLRPRLAVELAAPPRREEHARIDVAADVALSGARGRAAAAPARTRRTSNTNTAAARDDMPPPLSGKARGLAEKLEDWLRREAMIGAVVLLCVALLGAYAGSLAAAPTAAAPATKGPFVQTQTADGYAVSLKVTPDTFGTNTFYVTVKNAEGQPVNGASVEVTTDMLDMDMGEQTIQLQPLGAGSPGVYSGQGDLTMAGHWAMLVKVLPPGGKQPIQTRFTLTATY